MSCLVHSLCLPRQVYGSHRAVAAKTSTTELWRQLWRQLLLWTSTKIVAYQALLINQTTDLIGVAALLVAWLVVTGNQAAP